VPTRLLLRYLCPSLLLYRLDKERRRRRETYSTMLRMSTVALLALAPSAAPLLLLCSPLRRRRSPCAAPSLAPPHRPVRPALPDGTGTTAPTRGNRSIGRQLATKAAAQGEASGPGAEALWPRLLLWLRCPNADDGGGRTEIRYRLQLYILNVSDVLEVYCKCFIRMLQKLIGMLHMLQWVIHVCFKCMFQMFHLF
jgi:hypothetical protein